MKPLYVKKNGVVYKISGTGIPSIYPAANVEYDNTVTSELQATDVQGAIDELSTRQGGVQSDWNENDSTELDYIKNKPQNLVQDASYVHTDNNYDATAKGKVDSLGTASAKDVGVANGVAELDAAGKVPSSQLPSFVDDVIEVADYDHLPITGESGKIYVTLDTNKTYRWTGSGYAEISESLALGETSSTAYRGDRGKTAYDHATETKLSTATASGLYKVAATAQGHIASLTAVEKSDITALGIPGQDTNTKNTAYGTCDTAGNVKDKVATLSNATNWVLEVGTIVGVRFTYTNTCSLSGINLNVNNTGAKNIRYSDGILTSGTDPKCPTAFGEAGQTIYYMYDGTYWVWVSHSKDTDTTYAFDGNTFISEDGENYFHGGYSNGNANNMTANGHYYYKSNGPSTAIGAYGTDGAMFVQAYDSDNVAQIAQNYENGNIFVRGKANGTWTNWKKTIANIVANNAVLTTDKTPFLTRQTLNPTGFSGYVREKLIGCSVAWNQLVQNGDFASTSGWSAGNGTLSTSDNVLSYTITGLVGAYTNGRITRSCNLTSGHKILISIDVKPKYTNRVVIFAYTTTLAQTTTLFDITDNVANVWNTKKVIFNLPSDFTTIAIGMITNTNYVVGDVIQYRNFCITDLTLAFGSTIADYLYNLTDNGGITKLRDMGCPIDQYTQYGYGLYSVKTSGKKIVGFNKFNKSDISAGYIDINGNISQAYVDSYSHSGYISVLPNTDYYFGGTSGTNPAICWYDANKNFISGELINARSSFISTSPSNARYLVVSILNELLGTYKVNISKTTGSPKNGDYVPYSETTYSLGNDELRGKFDLVNGEIVASGDAKKSNGEITRNYGIVDLGSLNDWLRFQGSDGNYRFRVTVPSAKLSGNYGQRNTLCSLYALDSRTDTTEPNNKEYILTGMLYSSYVFIVIRDDSYTDATTFKTAMSGVYLIYEKATPTTEQSTPFADPMSLVGATTEEYIDTRDIPCPVGAERQYMGQSEDVVEIPSSPQSDGKRVLISEVSGGKEQVYWDIPKLYYKEYTVQGDGTKTYSDLLAELKPYYLTLSEDEKTYSKVMMRATSSGNECLTFVGNYWYSRMGVNASGLWLDQVDFEYNRYFKQASGGSITEETNTNAAYNVIALRVLTYTRAES